MLDGTATAGGSTMAAWWTCPVVNPDGSRCFDRMESNVDPRRVEHDRDAHLRERHPGAIIDPALLVISHWHVTGEASAVRV